MKQLLEIFPTEEPCQRCSPVLLLDTHVRMIQAKPASKILLCTNKAGRAFILKGSRAVEVILDDLKRVEKTTKWCIGCRAALTDRL